MSYSPTARSFSSSFTRHFLSVFPTTWKFFFTKASVSTCIWFTDSKCSTTVRCTLLCWQCCCDTFISDHTTVWTERQNQTLIPVLHLVLDVLSWVPASSVPNALDTGCLLPGWPCFLQAHSLLHPCPGRRHYHIGDNTSLSLLTSFLPWAWESLSFLPALLSKGRKWSLSFLILHHLNDRSPLYTGCKDSVRKQLTASSVVVRGKTRSLHSHFEGRRQLSSKRHQVRDFRGSVRDYVHCKCGDIALS